MNANISEELKETLALINTKVTRNIEIVSQEMLGVPYLIHIAKEKFKDLVPNISRRAAYSEDNTLPRIHTSNTLLNCINGYASLVWDVLNGDLGDKKDTYKGGYYIYFIPFEFALKPNKRLVYDADVTNEHWLISYNKETKTYKPSAMGRIINTRLEFIPNALTNKTTHSIMLAIEVPEKHQLQLDNDTILQHGYHYVNLTAQGERDLFKVEKYSRITKSVFDTYLTEKTNQLSLEAHQRLLYSW